MSFNALLDIDLVLFVILFVLFVWRWLCPWNSKFYGHQLKYTNYVVVLYVLMTLLLIFQIIEFATGLHNDFKKNITPLALRIILLVTIPVIMLIMALSAWQSKSHIAEIHLSSAVLKHDRAVQIIALPAVYSLMALGAMVHIYKRITSEPDVTPRSGLARYETSFHVADLYEAWAVFQFGKLTLELLDDIFKEKASSEQSNSESSKSMALSFTAVYSLAWLGTCALVVVCVVQAGWSLYLWTFQNPEANFSHYEAELSKFSYAGMVASAAAVYNVHIVESTFQDQIESYRPFLKFMSVKLLVSFAFWQMWVLDLLKLVHIVDLDNTQLKLLHAALIIYECLLSAVLHCFAWRASEEWYGQPSKSITCKEVEKGSTVESAPLLGNPFSRYS